ncbi:MAG: response regulator [Sedimenticola sp.]|nr:response regulator [Sedimenticola sp.]
MITNEIQTKPVSILLIEDDEVDAMGVERALRKNKILNKLYRARDGIEALELLRTPGGVDHPYIILLDLNMPRMNGLELLEELRRDPKLTESVVFVLTTSKDDEDRTAAYKNHVAGYILKKNVGDGFMELIDMLDRYWRLVELPQ